MVAAPDTLIATGFNFQQTPAKNVYITPDGGSQTNLQRAFPVILTAAQIASPTAAMLADLSATYRLNVAPYTRYYSDGTGLVESGGAIAGDLVVTGNTTLLGMVGIGLTGAGVPGSFADTMLNVTKPNGLYVDDNVMRIQNLDHTQVAAIKFQDPYNYNRGAFGYGPVDLPGSAFNQKMFVEIGNINGGATFTGTGGAAKTMVVTNLTGGGITIGSILTGTGVPASTTIDSQQGTFTGRNGTYVTNNQITSSGDTLTATDDQGTGFIVRATYVPGVGTNAGKTFTPFEVYYDGGVRFRSPRTTTAQGGFNNAYVAPATGYWAFGNTSAAADANRTARAWVDALNFSTGTWATSLAVASADIGPSNDGTTFGQYAYLRAAPTAVTGASAPQFGILEALTIGGGAATPYTGRVQVGRVTTDGIGIVASDTVGTVWFGGQWGTGSSYDLTKVVYPASIHGFAGATWTAAAAASAGLAFRTGIVGQVFSAVADAGTLAMQIQPTTRYVGIGQTDYNNANVPGLLTLQTTGGQGLVLNLTGQQKATLGLDQANTAIVLGSDATYSLDLRTGVTAGDATTGTSRFQVTTTRSIIKGIPNVATTATPASASAAGTTGDIAWDTGFLYVATGTNAWKRVAIASW